jgi:hypothetical protein
MGWQNIIGGSVSPTLVGGSIFLFGILMLWSLIWKGMALWKAARNESKVWFVVLLLVNTIGILDILYIYVFSKKSNKFVVEPPKQV